MYTGKFIFITALFIFISRQKAVSQQFNMGTKELDFVLPNALWHEAFMDSNMHINAFRTVFKREAVEAGNRVLVIPNIEIIVEDTKMDLKQYSTSKQRAIDIKIDSNLYAKNGLLKISDCKAYFGHYKRGNTTYKMCIIQFVNEGRGCQIVMDCTADIFDEVWVEMKYFVESLQLI
jgi:hypothetical protein